ncbi:MAG: hypothetical protein ABI743_09770, partial [bacterium]
MATLFCPVFVGGACQKHAPPPSPPVVSQESLVKRLTKEFSDDPTNARAGVELAEELRKAGDLPGAERVYGGLLQSTDPFTQGLSMNALAGVL